MSDIVLQSIFFIFLRFVFLCIKFVIKNMLQNQIFLSQLKGDMLGRKRI